MTNETIDIFMFYFGSIYRQIALKELRLIVDDFVFSFKNRRLAAKIDWIKWSYIEENDCIQ